MQVFLYDKSYAKRFKCAISVWRTLGLILAYSFCYAASLIALFAFEMDHPLLILHFLLGYMVWLIVWLVRQQPASQAPVIAYVLDADGLLWQVFLNQRYVKQTAYDIALQYYASQGQPIQPSLAGKFAYYVQCSRQGISHWNNVYGGEAKTTPLYHLSPLVQTKRAYKFQYCTAKGKIKKLTIPKGYPTLFRYLWGDNAV